MIEGKENHEKAILVFNCCELQSNTYDIARMKKPQIIHMYDYDIHFLSEKLNVESLAYYVERFHIDFLALNIQLTKNLSLCKQLIGKLKNNQRDIFIICTGEAITEAIAEDIGADGYTQKGENLIRVIENIERRHMNKES